MSRLSWGSSTTFWPVVLASYLSLFFFGLVDNIRGPFFSGILKSFSVGDTVGSLFFATTSIFAVLGSLWASSFLLRHGIVKSLRWGMVLVSVGFGGIALMPTFLSLIPALALFGLGLGLSGVSQNMAVTAFSATNQRRQLLSGLHALYGLASLAAPLLARPFLVNGWSWKWAFAIFASLPLTVVFWSYFITAPSEIEGEGVQSDIKPSGSNIRLHFLSITGAAYLVAEILVGTRLVRFLELTEGWSAAQGANYLAGFFILLFVGRIAFLARDWRQWSTDRVLVFSSLTGGLAMLAGVWVDPLWLAISGLLMGPFYPLMIDHAQTIFGRKSGFAVARIMAVGSLSVVGLHLLVGWITDLFSMRVAMMIGPMSLMISAGLLVAEQKVFRALASKPNP